MKPLLALLVATAGAALGATCDCYNECRQNASVTAGTATLLASGSCPYGSAVLFSKLRVQSSSGALFSLCTSESSSAGWCYNRSSPSNTTCFSDLNGFWTSFGTYSVTATCRERATPCALRYQVQATCLQTSSFEWVTGSWSACGADCHRTAPLSCVEDGKRVVGQGNCSGLFKPMWRQRCTASECPGVEPSPGFCRCWCSNTTIDDESWAGDLPCSSSTCVHDVCAQNFRACFNPVGKGFIGTVCMGAAAGLSAAHFLVALLVALLF
eukprot:m51a1_g1186 putative C-tail anchored protein (268) ;mRNA; f:402236-403109